MSNPADKLVTRNLGLVREIVKAYRTHPLYEDLYQEGVIGLIKASRKFNPDLGYAFSSFAYPHIKGAIQHFFRDKSHIIKPKRGERAHPVISSDAILTESGERYIENIPDRTTHFDPEKETLYEFIEFLPKLDQTIITLYLQGETYKEIAQTLSISVMTVPRRLNKIVKCCQEFAAGLKVKLTPYKKPVRGLVDSTPQFNGNTIDCIPVEDNILDPVGIYIINPNPFKLNELISNLYLLGRKLIYRRYFELQGIISWEDLLHESIFKLREFILEEKVKDYQHAIALMYLFAKYSYFKQIRQRSKYISWDTPLKKNINATIQDTIADTSQHTVEQAELVQLIEQGIAELPSLEKKVADLAWKEGLGVSQIARILQKTIPVISIAIHKIRIKLARFLNGRGMSLGYY